MTHITREAYLDLLDKEAKPKERRQQPEKAIQLSCIKYLRMKGYYCGKLKTVGGRVGNKFIYDRYQARGCPDLICFMPRLVFLEIKVAKGVQSDDQKWFQELCVKANIPYLLVHSLTECMEKIIELEG